MKGYTKLIVLANLAALLGYLAYSTVDKEALLSNGELILLELAPQDPRSLMQGDYMRLDYAIARGQAREVEHKRGYVVLQTDEDHIGRALRYQPHKSPLAKGETIISYQKKDWSLDVGAGSYFFQEGRTGDFAEAKYGGLKVDGEGHSLLVGLYDKDRRLIE